MNIGEKALKYLSIPFYTLALWGIWLPRPEDSKKFTFKLKLVILGIYIVCVIYHTVSSYNEIRGGTFNMDDFVIYANSFGCFYKCGIILWKKRRVDLILSYAFADKWICARDSGETKIIDKFEKECRFVHRAFLYTILGTLFCYFIRPIFDPKIKGFFPFKMWFPYELSTPFRIFISYLQVVLLLCSDATNTMAAELMLVGFMMQVRTQLELLRYRVIGITKGISDDHQGSKKSAIEAKVFAQLIRDHQDIYKLARWVDNFGAWFLIPDMMIVIPNICINLYLLTSMRSYSDIVTTFALIIYFLFEIFLLCWFGNECYVASIEAIKAFHDAEWLKLNLKTKKKILMALCATQPVEFVVLKIVKINIASFGKILKLGYSAFSVLRKMKTT